MRKVLRTSYGDAGWIRAKDGVSCRRGKKCLAEVLVISVLPN